MWTLTIDKVCKESGKIIERGVGHIEVCHIEEARHLLEVLSNKQALRPNQMYQTRLELRA